MSDKSKGLKARTEQNKNAYSGDSRIFDLSKIEGEVKFYKPSPDKTNKLDIIPYIVGSNRHPQGLKKGSWDYILDIFIHKNIGLANAWCVCPARNFNKPCPICEEADAAKEAGDEDLWGEIKAKRRGVYCVIDLNDKEAGVQIFDEVHFFFEKEMMDKLKFVEAETGEGTIVFSDPEEGKTICFRATEEKFGKATFFKYKDFDFRDREKQYKESITEKSYPLDDLLVVKTYDELKEILHNIGDEEEDEDSEDETTDDTEIKESREEKRKALKKRKLQKQKEESGEKAPKCPHGHKFGEETDDHTECKKCEMWDACANAFEKSGSGE